MAADRFRYLNQSINQSVSQSYFFNVA